MFFSLITGNSYNSGGGWGEDVWVDCDYGWGRREYLACDRAVTKLNGRSGYSETIELFSDLF